jgi:hypothetical protein
LRKKESKSKLGMLFGQFAPVISIFESAFLLSGRSRILSITAMIRPLLYIGRALLLTCLLVSSFLFAKSNDSRRQNKKDTIPFYDPSRFLPGSGPRNYDSSNYAVICLYRPSSLPGEKLWFAVIADEEEIARISESNRWLVKIPREGRVKIESRYNSVSAVDLDIRFGQTYYIRVEGALSGNKVTAKLDHVENQQGMEENKKEIWKDHYLDYPWPEDIFHIHMMQNIKYEPRYVLNMTDSIPFFNGKFLPPVTTRFYYYLPSSEPYELPHYHFVYINRLLSRTYYKEINLYRDDHKIFDSVDDLQNYIRNSIRDGKRLTAGNREALISLNFELIPEFEEMTAGYFAEIKQEKKDENGNGFTELRREFVIYRFKRTKGSKKIFPTFGNMNGVVILVSESGLPEELHSKEELEGEALAFCRGVSF